jgi:hypothetical protein
MSLAPSRFELRDGVNWPRRIQIAAAGKTVMEFSCARKFDVGR